jgi:hypothetical protein
MPVVDNLFERSPIRFADRLERPVSGIPDTEQISQLGSPGPSRSDERTIGCC